MDADASVETALPAQEREQEEELATVEEEETYHAPRSIFKNTSPASRSNAYAKLLTPGSSTQNDVEITIAMLRDAVGITSSSTVSFSDSSASTSSLHEVDTADILLSTRVLHLEWRHITKIGDALDLVHHVRDLYLQHNNIRVLEGIDCLRSLEFLSLQGNQIKSLGNSLRHLSQSLKVLDISDNYLEEIPIDGALPESLRIFNGYGNPVAKREPQDNKYREVLISVCPGLIQIDGGNVVREEAKKGVEGGGGGAGEADEEEGKGVSSPSKRTSASPSSSSIVTTPSKKPSKHSPTSSSSSVEFISSPGSPSGLALQESLVSSTTRLKITTAAAATAAAAATSTTANLSILPDAASSSSSSSTLLQAAAAAAHADITETLEKYSARRSQLLSRYRERLTTETIRSEEFAKATLLNSEQQLEDAKNKLSAARAAIAERSRARNEAAAAASLAFAAVAAAEAGTSSTSTSGRPSSLASSSSSGVSRGRNWRSLLTTPEEAVVENEKKGDE